jgi:hypothetical protein
MVPVVLFAYARPHHLRRTLQSLRANSVPLIYAYSDGPSTPAAAGNVAEVRGILRGVDWCEISIVERPVNSGLGQSIRAGVTEVLGRHESELVFEDDLVCVDGAYAYLAAALEHYKNDSRVMSVTGWTHPRITPANVHDQPYFDGRAECWLWGTWRRAWSGMNDGDALALSRRCEQLGIDPCLYGSDLMAMARMEHEQNIWAVRFLYLHILQGGLCLRPPHSLVEHIGFDAEATNAGVADGWANPPLKGCPPVPSVWPRPSEHPDCRELAVAAFGSRPEGPALNRRLRTRVRQALPDALLRAYRRLKVQKIPKDRQPLPGRNDG